jgi:hypothetical protein
MMCRQVSSKSKGSWRSGMAAFPIFHEVLGAGISRVLFVISVCYWFSSLIIEGIHQQPVRGIVGNRIANPFDVVK